MKLRTYTLLIFCFIISNQQIIASRPHESHQSQLRKKANDAGHNITNTLVHVNISIGFATGLALSVAPRPFTRAMLNRAALPIAVVSSIVFTVIHH